MIKKIVSKDAPEAIGPYSHGMIANGLFFSSGQIPLDPVSGEMIKGGIAEQTRRVMENLALVLKEAGLSWEHVVKTTIYLSDMTQFQIINQIYGEYLGDQKPARSTVGIKELPKGAAVEIDLVAAIP
ncbi:MAG: RidA family protein [Deltaproteobacteria bacterium]|nr:RidA family protein [Deltaproteobacteria bacterium]